MVLDVQFQLFVCFALYGVFLTFVISNFQRALDDWKALNDGDDEGQLAINTSLYKTCSEILTHRVQKSSSLHQIFAELQLRLANVDGLSNGGADGFDFSLHLYLTDALGKALEYLVEVSLKSNVFLAISALLVAVLAHHYQVAFMYFLPIFIVIGFSVLVGGFLMGRNLRRQSRDHDHDKPLTWVTVHSYCRAIQIALYCVFFSFSRLLLSNDIFTDYPKVYLAAFVGLVIILFLAWLCGGEIIKETICAIVLPPQINDNRFKKNLQLVVYWHTTLNCHECGVRQLPRTASLSREFAGCKAVARPDSPQDTTRQFSWR